MLARTTLRARAAIARGRYADAEKLLTPAAASAPSSDAALELGLLQQYLGRRQDARRTLQRVLDGAPLAHRRRLHARRPRRAGAGRVQGRQRRVLPARQPAGARRRRAQHRVGRSVPREVRSAQRAEVVSGRAQGRRERRGRARGAGARGRRGQSARGQGSARSGAQDQSQLRAGASAVGGAGARRPPARRRRGVDQEGARGQSEQPRGRSRCRPARRSPPTSPPRPRRSRKRRSRSTRPTARSIASWPITRRAAISSTRRRRSCARGSSLDPNNAQAYADLGMYLLRTGDEGEARMALERAFKDDPYNVVHVQLAGPARHARQVRDDHRRRPRLQVPSRRSGGDARAGDAAGQGSAGGAVEALSVHAQGAAPHRDVPQARRLRRAHHRAARHDRRARRLLRPRRDARLAAGAPARRIQLGRDAVARAGARHHAADVGQPRAAVAHRRDLGVRGAPRAARVGQGVGRLVRAGARRRQGASSSTC